MGSVRHPTMLLFCGAGVLLCACATAPSGPPLTLQEAGLDPLPARPVFQRHLTPLEAATDALLIAIERQTGERPAFDDEPVPDPNDVAVGLQNTRVGRASGRSALALEMLQELGSIRPSIHDLARARATLIWDAEVDGRRLDPVDAGLVADALTRTDRALGIREVPQESDESVSVFAFDAATPWLIWPVSPVRITSPFGERVDPLGEGLRRHQGIDLAAYEGELVHAAAGGRVIFVGRRGGYGIHVEVRHTDGFVTRYAHLSRALVVLGEHVQQGEVIGRAGHTGRATGPHLHFEVWHHGVAMNPLHLLVGSSASYASR